MGHNWHTILPLLVALISLFAFPSYSVTDVNIIDNNAGLLSEAYFDQQMRSYFGYGANPHDNLANFIDDILDFVQYIHAYVSGFDFATTDQGTHSELRVFDHDTHSKLDTLIDTNQFYLSAILEELKRKEDYPFSASFLSDALVHGQTLGWIYRDIWYESTNNYWQLLNRDYGVWQSIAMQPFFDYDFSQLEGKVLVNPNRGLEKYDFYNAFKSIFGSGDPEHDATIQQVNTFFTGGLGKLKMKYYGTYPLTVLTSNLVTYVTNQIPFSIINSPYLVEDSDGNVLVDTNSVSYAFSERLVSNNLSSVSAVYSGPSNAVWDVGEETEVGSHFSSMFSVTNSLRVFKETFDDLISNLNESPNTMNDALSSLKGGSGVFVIEYHPNFWIQGMPEAPTQSIRLEASSVLSPDVVNIITFVKTFALFGGSMILGITTFYSIMKENPLWFN